MSENREEALFDCELNRQFWIDYIEARESEAQARDEAYVQDFWAKRNL